MSKNDDYSVQDFDNKGGMQAFSPTEPSDGFGGGGMESYGGTMPPTGGWSQGSGGGTVPPTGGAESYSGTMPPTGGWPQGSGGGTVPPTGGWPQPNVGGVESYPGTEPSRGWMGGAGMSEPVASAGRPSGGMQGYEPTTPANMNGPGYTMPPQQVPPGWHGQTAPAPEWLDPNAAERTRPSHNGPIPSYDSYPPYPSPMQRATPAAIFPVVGWLVCTKGREQGRSFPIHPENNYVGREASMDISLSDPVISRTNQFVISYVTRTRKFYASSSGGKNITELNDIPLSNTVELHAFDRFVVDTAEFRFVPFCGEQFGWDDVYKDEKGK